MTIETTYGTITEANSNFGYGFVTIEDSKIVYRDSMVWKSWKTVKAFEKWIEKQNKMCGGVFSKIETREYAPINGGLSWC